MVQNQAGNKPLKWLTRGVVVEVLPNRQYKVRMDGSRMISYVTESVHPHP